VIFAPPPAAPNAGNINSIVNSNNNHHLEKLKLRESLTVEIVADVEYEINDLLAWAPEGLTERTAKRSETKRWPRPGSSPMREHGRTPERRGTAGVYVCAVATARRLINVRMAQASATGAAFALDPRRRRKGR